MPFYVTIRVYGWNTNGGKYETEFKQLSEADRSENENLIKALAGILYIYPDAGRLFKEQGFIQRRHHLVSIYQHKRS